MQSSIFRDAELVFLRNQHADAISALSALDSQFAQLDKEKSIMASKIQQARNEKSICENEFLNATQSKAALMNQLDVVKKDIEEEKLLHDQWALKISLLAPIVEKAEFSLIPLRSEVNLMETKFEDKKRIVNAIIKKSLLIEGEIEILKSLLDSKQKELDSFNSIELTSLLEEKESLTVELTHVKRICTDLSLSKKQLELFLRNSERNLLKKNTLDDEISDLAKLINLAKKDAEQFEKDKERIRVKIAENSIKNSNVLDSISKLESEILIKTEIQINVNRELKEFETDRIESLLYSTLSSSKLFMSEIGRNQILIHQEEEAKKKYSLECNEVEKQIRFLSIKAQKLSKESIRIDNELNNVQKEYDSVMSYQLEMTKKIELKQNEFETISVENEFLKQKLGTIATSLLVFKKKNLELSKKIEEIKFEISQNQKTNFSEQIKLDILTIQTDLDFLISNNLIHSDGRIKALLLPIDRFGVNAFLTAVQSEEDIEKTILSLIEKISEFLQLIVENEKIKTRLESQLKQISEISTQLTTEENSLSNQIEVMKNIEKSRHVQMALNSVDYCSTVVLESGLDEFISRLDEERKKSITGLQIKEEISEIQFEILVFELINLCVLEIHFHEKLDIIRFLETKINGITSVVHFGNTVIAYSGTRTRLTVTIS